VLGSVVGRTYLTQFLEQVGSISLIGYWAAVEELRQTSRSSWHQLGADIFYKYINTPSPDIRVDKVSNSLCWSRRTDSNIVCSYTLLHSYVAVHP
jgi:sorting nexin-25